MSSSLYWNNRLPMYIFFSRLNPTILVFMPKYIFSSKLVFLKFPEFQLSYTRKFGTLWAVLQTARTNRCSYRLTVASFVVAIFQFFSSFFPAKKKRFRSSWNSPWTIWNVIYFLFYLSKYFQAIVDKWSDWTGSWGSFEAGMYNTYNVCTVGGVNL